MRNQPKILFKEVQWLLEYAITYPNAVLWYYESDMQLSVESDEVYLILPKVCSRIARYFRLADSSNKNQYTNNGTILIECHSLRSVVSLVVEAMELNSTHWLVIWNIYCLKV